MFTLDYILYRRWDIKFAQDIKWNKNEIILVLDLTIDFASFLFLLVAIVVLL